MSSASATPPLADRPRTVVVGAGVVGLTTAYELATRGHRVTVVDSEAAPGMLASFLNGSLICPSLLTPWANSAAPPKIWSSFALAVQSRFGAVLQKYRSEEPQQSPSQPQPVMKLHLHSLRDAAIWRWGLHYLRNCTDERSKRNGDSLFALSQFSIACLADIKQRLGSALELSAPSCSTGTLQIASSEAAYKQMVKASAPIVAQYGEKVR